MAPAEPPTAVTLPAETLVGVTFRFGFCHCSLLKRFVVVISMRSVGAPGRSASRNLLCRPPCQTFSPGPTMAPRSAVPYRPIGEPANAATLYQAAIVGSSRFGSDNWSGRSATTGRDAVDVKRVPVGSGIEIVGVR